MTNGEATRCAHLQVTRGEPFAFATVQVLDCEQSAPFRARQAGLSSTTRVLDLCAACAARVFGTLDTCAKR